MIQYKFTVLKNSAIDSIMQISLEHLPSGKRINTEFLGSDDVISVYRVTCDEELPEHIIREYRLEVY